jgi:hypothetical protein
VLSTRPRFPFRSSSTTLDHVAALVDVEVQVVVAVVVVAQDADLKEAKSIRDEEVALRKSILYQMSTTKLTSQVSRRYLRDHRGPLGHLTFNLGVKRIAVIPLSL